MPPVRKQVIQRRRVGEGPILTHRRIFVLLPSVGTKGRSIEGHQRRTGGLGSIETLDSRVGFFRHRRFPGDKAAQLLPFRILTVMTFPGTGQGFVVAGILIPVCKGQVAPGDQIFPLPGKNRVRAAKGRVIIFKEPADCLGKGVLAAGQQRAVQFLRRCEALSRPAVLGRILGVAQEIGPVVPKEVGGHAHSPLYRCGQLHLPWPGFSPLVRRFQGDDPADFAALSQFQSVGNAALAPALPGNFSSSGQIFIVGRQRL